MLKLPRYDSARACRDLEARSLGRLIPADPRTVSNGFMVARCHDEDDDDEDDEDDEDKKDDENGEEDDKDDDEQEEETTPPKFAIAGYSVSAGAP